MIVIARHGETEWNKIGLMQGRLNSPLTPQGIRQVNQLARHLRKGEWNRLFSSPLGRSCQTSLAVSNALNQEVCFDPRLKEIDFGKFSGKSESRIRQCFPKFWENRSENKWNVKWPSGESYSSAFQRAASFVDSRKPFSQDIIVAHRSFNRLLVGKFLGLKPKECLSINQGNEVVIKITSSGLIKEKY